MKRKPSAAEPVPHSWSIDDWPASVFPGRASRGRYLCRVHRTELLAEGALTRVGRDLVILGAAYTRWMAKRAEHVANYDIAPNRSQAAT